MTVSPGGEGGIRTHETLAGLPVFKTGTFNHSVTSPWTTEILAEREGFEPSLELAPY